MPAKSYDFCIVGAGPSGLTAAYQLLKGGSSVLLLERDSRVGGLAKSYDYNGNIFDTGPKRFHTDDKVVLDFIGEVLAGSILTIPRSTTVHFLNKYFQWPLQTKEIFKMPLPVALKCCQDLLQERKVDDLASFPQYVISKYGRTLYDIFFAPYTGKFLRWNPEDIHSDWASTGINRTVIDKRIKSNTLFDILKSVLLPAKIDTKFLYPKQGGFGGFYEKLLALCQGFANFELRVNDSVAHLMSSAQGVELQTKQGVSVGCRQLIWTGNLNNLMELIGADQKLHYLNTVFYNVICREEGVKNHRSQWIYVSRGDSLVSRITCMKEFADYTCNRGYYNFICELTDSQIKPVYMSNPQQYTENILDEVVQMSFLNDRKYVEDVKINPVEDTYPIYHKNYSRHFAAAKAQVGKFSARIHLLGRCGAFWYNNSDHSIRFAIELAKKLLGKSTGDFEYRDYFGGNLARSTHPQGAA